MLPNSSPRWVFPSVSIRVLLLSELRPQPPTHSAPLIKLFQWKLHSSRATRTILRKRSEGFATPCFHASKKRLNSKQFFSFSSFVFSISFFVGLSKSGLMKKKGLVRYRQCLRLHRNRITFWLQAYQYRAPWYTQRTQEVNETLFYVYTYIYLESYEGVM
jgi:hypothetical protein